MVSYGLKKIKAPKRKPKYVLTNISETDQSLTFTLPLMTVSEANTHQHWTVAAKRHKEQKSMVSYFLNPHRKKVKLPCCIHFVRLAPRRLDALDNLPTSLKFIIDATCEIVTGIKKAGRADDSPLLTLSVGQEKNDYGVRIEISWENPI